MTTIAPALRLLTAVRNNAVLVARPRGVVHVHDGQLTRTRTAVPAAARPFCGTRTRRLRVVATTTAEVAAAVAGGRRFCRSCTTRLPARLGGDAVELGTRDGWMEVFADLTQEDLFLAAAWCLTVDETHQVQRTVQMLFGSRHQAPELHRAVEQRRADIVARSRTPEEIAAAAAAREAELANRRQGEKTRRREIAIARATDHALRGSYLLPHERQVLDSA